MVAVCIAWEVRNTIQLVVCPSTTVNGVLRLYEGIKGGCFGGPFIPSGLHTMDRALAILIARFHHVIHHHHRHHCPHGQTRAEEGQQEQRRARRTVWVRKYLTEQYRRELGHYYTLLDLNRADFDNKMFRNYTRMTQDIFLEVPENILLAITKEDTRLRMAIEPGLKLAVTLRYLATGDGYRSLSYAFRVGVATISKFLPQACSAITDAYNEEAFPEDWSEDGWKVIADKFNTHWNMPHTMGALDGKHVAIKKPKQHRDSVPQLQGFFLHPHSGACGCRLQVFVG